MKIKLLIIAIIVVFCMNFFIKYQTLQDTIKNDIYYAINKFEKLSNYQKTVKEQRTHGSSTNAIQNETSEEMIDYKEHINYVIKNEDTSYTYQMMKAKENNFSISKKEYKFPHFLAIHSIKHQNTTKKIGLPLITKIQGKQIKHNHGVIEDITTISSKRELQKYTEFASLKEYLTDEYKECIHLEVNKKNEYNVITMRVNDYRIFNKQYRFRNKVDTDSEDIKNSKSKEIKKKQIRVWIDAEGYIYKIVDLETYVDENNVQNRIQSTMKYAYKMSNVLNLDKLESIFETVEKGSLQRGDEIDNIIR